jgi:hypothetical protein
VNRNFSQTITMRCDDPERIIELLKGWDRNQATSDIMGYVGTRILADREEPGPIALRLPVLWGGGLAREMMTPEHARAHGPVRGG